MHVICGDARTATKELRELGWDAPKYPESERFLEKLEHEFTPQFFHGAFWVHVAIKVLGQRYREGDGHHVFLRMRGYYRRMRGFVTRSHHLSRKERRQRHAEAIRFCETIAETDPSP